MINVFLRLALLPRRLGILALTVALIVVGITGLTLNVVPRPPWAIDPADPRVTLADVEREVGRYYGKPEISATDLRKRLTGRRVALFDIRSAEEFAAGHLPGAIHVDPDMTADGFLAAHLDKLQGREAVFYCAVGVRSAVMMRRLAVAGRMPAGAYNLRGGIFRWVADGGSLVAASGPGAPHPYDAAWEQLLRRETSAR